MNFDDELQEKSTTISQEREISLGTGTILGIFLVLTLICAAFFGFGYSMGRHSEKAALAPVSADTAVKAETSGSAFSNFKAAPVPAPTTPVADPPAPQPTVDPASSPAPSETGSAPAADGTVVQPPVSADGTWMVQVSATTRKPDADALSKVLVRQGFTTSIRPDADQKFHVRVGPYAAKKDADTTRKLLVASGYKDPFVTPK